jgi:hypothetical protein
VQLLAEAHETASRVASIPPDGLGTGWTAQVLPSQYSASGKSDSPAPLRTEYHPTAVQLAVAVHETPYRLPPFAPVGSGVG